MSGVGTLIVFLSAHVFWAYIILFLGSFLETLIGFSFFLYGEVFFLSGAMLAGAGVLNIWLVALVVYVGGILGDSSSYWIGRLWGVKLFEREIWFLNMENHDKGKVFFDKHGVKAVFTARFLGPISWITPFLAGMYRVPYSQFLKYNIPAVIIGIGQFLIAGYLFGAAYQTFINNLHTYGLLLLAILGGFLLLGYFVRKQFMRE